MIDLHVHILPGLDDGPKSMEESLEMCRVAHNDGITKIVATPHTGNGVYHNDREVVIAAVAKLNEGLVSENIPLQIFPGADVRIDAGLFELLENNQTLTVNDKRRYIMIEFPEYLIPPQIEEWIFRMKLKKITPIFTHPERNMIIHKNMEIVHTWIEKGGLVQITAMSITGDWGKGVRKCAEELLKARLVHVIASDAHSATRRPPILSKAVADAAKLIGETEARRMVTTIPQAILDGKVFYPPEPIRKKTGFLERIFRKR